MQYNSYSTSFKTMMIQAMILLSTLTIHTVLPADFSNCPRDQSRVVRKVITVQLYPVYETEGVAMPTTCDFHGNRDMYLQQETNKLEEGSSKWTCQFCGKAFYEQRFLDHHFDNKHLVYVKKGRNIVCLAEYCDIFRCKVQNTRRKVQDNFWDKALCRDKDVEKLRDKCNVQMKKCIPNHFIGMERHIFLEKLTKNVCDYLTCEKYWELSKPEMHPASVALYIVATSILIWGLMVYYYVACAHFYTDSVKRKKR